MPSSTSMVFCRPVIPLDLSSSLQSVQNLSLSSLHLHPSMTSANHTLMSSMYLTCSSVVMLLLATRDMNFSSHQSMMILAIAHVDLKPIGPPFFCRKNLPPNSYTWVLKRTRTAIFMTVATTILFSKGVNLILFLNFHWSWLPLSGPRGSSPVTPGLTPWTCLLVGNILLRGDILHSCAVLFMAMYLHPSMKSTPSKPTSVSSIAWYTISATCTSDNDG